jgi:hypothetical protein
MEEEKGRKRESSGRRGKERSKEER